MTTDPTRRTLATDEQRARLDALRQRRPSRAAAPPPAVATRWAPATRRHVAGRARVVCAAGSIATMLGLVGVMALARPASSATPAVPEVTTSATLPPLAPSAGSSPVSAPPPPPTAATRPIVQQGGAATTVPTARTHGSR